MTLIVCAIKSEVKPFLKALENTRIEKCKSQKVYQGTIRSKSVLVVRCGVGLKKAAAATKLMIDNYKITCVIMSGTAGGVDSRLKIGDTVVSEEILYHERNDRILEGIAAGSAEQIFKADTKLLFSAKKAARENLVAQSVYFGRITSGSKFVTGKTFKDVAKKFEPLCLDMETAAVAHVCAINNTPFIAIRSTSDTAEKSGILTFYRNVILASESSFHLVEKMLCEK